MSNVFKISLIKKEQNCIKYLKRFKKDKIYTCFSGGKDSLVVLDLAFKSGIKNVVFCDTTIEFQETLDYLDEVEKFYNINIERISAPCSFFDLVKKIGFPSRSYRWCCKVFKFSPLSIFAREKKLLSYITGLRSEENKRRSNYKKRDQNPQISAKRINPILDWSKQEVWSYIRKYNLPANPIYSLGFNRIGCWPCPFKTNLDWKLIKENFPNKYATLQKALKSIYKECEGIGIDNIDDFIENNKWTCYSRPQNSELKGKIEVLPETTFIHLENHNQLKKMKMLLPILSKDYEIIRNSIIINKQLRRQSVKILVEKSLNCVGCGACITFCESLYINQGYLEANEENCRSCLKCLNTSKMKGACVVRGYSPFRIEVRTCQDLLFEDDLKKNTSKLNSRTGLIRTRVSLKEIEEKFKNIAKIIKNDKYIYLKNGKFEANAYKSKGYVEVQIFPHNIDLEDAMNFYRKVMA